jgi:hypothetical protein
VKAIFGTHPIPFPGVESFVSTLSILTLYVPMQPTHKYFKIYPEIPNTRIQAEKSNNEIISIEIIMDAYPSV